MLVEISRLLEYVSNPSSLLTISVIVGAAAMAMRQWRLAVQIHAITVAIVVFVGILPGGVWLALPLERWYPEHPSLPAKVAGIVALGGTQRPAQSAAWNQPILSDPTPIATLVALGRNYPDARLVFTGGSHPSDAKNVTESRIVHEFLLEMGVDADRLLYEDRSRNTLENALFSRDLVRPNRSEPWILVGQAISLPRAVAVFRHLGWDVIPYPAGYLTSGDPSILAPPDLAGGLRLASLALHEWGGLIVYRIMGYTDQLIPR